MRAAEPTAGDGARLVERSDTRLVLWGGGWGRGGQHKNPTSPTGWRPATDSFQVEADRLG